MNTKKLRTKSTQGPQPQQTIQCNIFGIKKIDGKRVFRAVVYGLAFNIYSLLQKTAHESCRWKTLATLSVGERGVAKGWRK
jgi:hypothetical protein